jgi:DNA gyrase/topoisomerase IV subunit B
MIEKYNVLEHIRMRPAMYIGFLNHFGFNELVSYFIEDFIRTEIYDIIFILKKDNRLIMKWTSPEKTLFITEIIKSIDQYKQGEFYLSLAGIIALTEYSSIEINGLPVLQSEKGNFDILDSINHINEEEGCSWMIDFIPDQDIFKGLILSYKVLNDLFRRFSFLNPNLKIRSIDESGDEQQINIFHYSDGLAEIIDYEVQKRLQYDFCFFTLNFQKKTEYSYSVAFAFVDSQVFKPKIKMYANYKETILGGSLLDGIIQGFKMFLKKEAAKRNMKLNISSSRLKKHLLLYGSVQGDLTFLGSTRWKLGTPKVQTEIKKFMYEELKLYFANNEDKAIHILQIIQDE